MLFFNIPGKIYFFSSMENVTSFFSYKWIKYLKFLDKTGICLSFRYKITGDNNTLSMYFATLSGKKTLVWKVHGNHGNAWKNGKITYWPSESLSVIFSGRKMLCAFLVSFFLVPIHSSFVVFITILAHFFNTIYILALYSLSSKDK